MEFQESRTFANLMAAFAGEAQARNKYTYYAEKAKKEGYIQIGRIFEETAKNELEHAEIWFKYIKGGSIPSTLENLEDAAAGEWYEFSDMYKGFAETAKEEGYLELETLFNLVAKIEKEHHDRFEKLKSNMENKELFERKEVKVWICLNCGNVYVGEKAPEVCPVCKKPQGYFEIKADNY